MKRILTAALALGFVAGAAIAQPSEYFLWKHKTNGQSMCNPDAPGRDWVKQSGPYEDPNCKIKLPQ
jgi:hypothetical protein